MIRAKSASLERHATHADHSQCRMQGNDCGDASQVIGWYLKRTTMVHFLVAVASLCRWPASPAAEI